jgi:hypothetical protein
MDYITRYYKTLSEDLQRRLNLLEDIASTMIANQNNQSNNQADIQFLPYPPFIAPNFFTNPNTPLQPPTYRNPYPDDGMIIPDDDMIIPPGSIPSPIPSPRPTPNTPIVPKVPTQPAPGIVPVPGPVSPAPRPTPSPQPTPSQQPDPTPSTPPGPDKPDPRAYPNTPQGRQEYANDYYKYMKWYVKQPKDWQRSNPPPRLPQS